MFTIKSRVWLESQEKTFLGDGRIALLKGIQKHGSISKAAKEMSMSYKKAWDLIDSINSSTKHVLVKKETGGKGGGGTKLTPHGEQAITLYDELVQLHRKQLDELMANSKLNHLFS